METKLTIDQAGRVLIPKALREDLRLGPGDVMELVSTEDEIRLKPVRAKALLKKELGVWVYQGETVPAGSASDAVDVEREKRIRDLQAL